MRKALNIPALSPGWQQSFRELAAPEQPAEKPGQPDDQVWVRLRMRGRHTGPFVRYRDGALDQAIPPTGHDIDFEQIHVLGLREGKVVSHEAVRDDIPVLGQLGSFRRRRPRHSA
ncbi:ester cyclase [Streptomyces sp. NPDC046759]|uniref:ester cyclase n=1 Tax=Streptomyces sp. NPDC046759 TaxID=3155019 RepID=UPI0033CA175D